MTEKQFQHSRFIKIMSWQAFKILEAATLDIRTVKYEIGMSTYFTAKRPSRMLTSVIQKYVRAVGGHCRENSQGSLRKERGKWKFNYTGGNPGEADLTVYLNGKAMEVELKIGRDKQSDAQIAYQKRMDRAGIGYYIVKDFDQFLNILNKQT